MIARIGQFLMALVLFVPHAVFAQKYAILEQLPGMPANPTFAQYIETLYTFAISAVGIAALFMLVVGGFWYMTSAGNQAQATTAKGIVRDALLGVIVALCAWLLLNIINPNILSQ